MKNLMIVDMQNGFIDKDNYLLIDNINNLLMKENFENVYYTEFYNSENSSYVNFVGWKEMMGSEINQKFCVKFLKGKVFFKNTYGLSSTHIKILKKNKIKEIYLCGTNIESCVLAIAFQLFDNGIRPFFIMNCCGSTNDDKSLKKKIEPILKINFGEDCIV